MIIINTVSTKTGDNGKTLGAGYKRTNKECLDIEFLGKLDELNCDIGFVYLNLKNQNDIDVINLIQHQIFDIGSFFYKNECLDFSEWVLKIEKEIEENGKNLPQLTSFLIPRGSLYVLHLHKARVSARNAERVFWKYYNKLEENKNMLIIGKYLNRLSDYFFTLIRKVEEKTLWIEQTSKINKT